MRECVQVHLKRIHGLCIGHGTGKLISEGATMFVRKWCLMVAALQFWLLSLALKLSLTKLFPPLRAEAGPFVPRWEWALFGMQWL